MIVWNRIFWQLGIFILNSYMREILIFILFIFINVMKMIVEELKDKFDSIWNVLVVMDGMLVIVQKV